MMIDPRDKKSVSAEDVLTEESEDELADLEKEFEARKQKLLEERARRLERKKNIAEVERSPSPPRQKTPPRVGQVVNSGTEKDGKTTTTSLENLKESDHSRSHNTIHRANRPAPSTAFADQLYASKSEQTACFNFNDRFFEFDNLPAMIVERTTESTEKDEVSGEILSRRYFKTTDIERLLTNVKILRAPKLLAKIVPPKFEEPTYTNWCMTGIVMHKSEPKTAVNNKKYMALRVGNFHHTVDVMLFGEAFQKYWKVRVGDAIVILNPTVKKFGNKFNLTIQDDLDSILELGTLKNYGHCSATTNHGQQCKHVVDKLKNVLCSFHEEAKYKHGTRMELQGSVKPKAPKNIRGEASEMYLGAKTLFVQHANTGFLEKDLVYSGGEQYDSSKYDRAIESKSSKLRKERANAKLEEQLLTTVAPRHLNDLAKLGILKQKREMADKVESAQKIRKHAFNSTFITGMGFDPTVTNNRSGGNGKGKNQLQQLEELRLLSQRKKISLEPSIEDQAKKRSQWQQAINAAKNGCSGKIDGGEKNSFTRKNAKTPPRPPRHIVVSSLDESDIEITFTNDDDRLHYEASTRNQVTGE